MPEGNLKQFETVCVAYDGKIYTHVGTFHTKKMFLLKHEENLILADMGDCKIRVNKQINK
jgi:hypothetical protein